MSELIDDIRIDHHESKQAKISKIELETKDLQERLYATLYRRNSLSPKKVPEGVLAVHLQAIVTSAEIAGLVDALEGMGKIDKVDYAARCVERLRRLVATFEGSH